ncbi:MAG TPA: hypothetical protein VIH10_05280 [Kribbella sp.]|jgi:hypothetical protein
MSIFNRRRRSAVDADPIGAFWSGSGNLLAHETSAGTRVLHYYTDSTTPADTQLQAATTGWPHGKVTLTTHPDPTWHNIAHLSG